MNPNLQTIKNLYVECTRFGFSMDFKTAMAFYRKLEEFKTFIKKIPKRTNDFEPYYKRAKSFYKELEIFQDF